jgi:hypothetical protein
LILIGESWHAFTSCASRFRVGDNPDGIAFDRANIWVADSSITDSKVLSVTSTIRLHEGEASMTKLGISSMLPTKNKLLLSEILMLLTLATMSHAQNSNAKPHCKPIGGTVMTDLAVVDQSTTLGIVAGDLKGSVAATILNVSEGADGTVIFAVQHHFVTESGDVILTKQATAITRVVVPGLYAVLSYPVQITGGTGKYAGATGEFDNIGAADLNTGRTVFPYSAHVCFGAPENP